MPEGEGNPEKIIEGPHSGVTVDQILDIVESAKIDSPEKEALKGALDKGWSTILNLLKDGGVISASGEVLPLGTSGLPAILQGKVQQRVMFSETLAAVRGKYGFNVETPGLTGKSKIYFFSAGSEGNLWYYGDRGGRELYIRVNRGRDKPVDVPFPLKAFSNIMDNVNQEHGVQGLIPPSLPARRMLVEIADHWGKGRQTHSYGLTWESERTEEEKLGTKIKGYKTLISDVCYDYTSKAIVSDEELFRNIQIDEDNIEWAESVVRGVLSECLSSLPRTKGISVDSAIEILSKLYGLDGRKHIPTIFSKYRVSRGRREAIERLKLLFRRRDPRVLPLLQFIAVRPREEIGG